MFLMMFKIHIIAITGHCPEHWNTLLTIIVSLLWRIGWVIKLLLQHFLRGQNIIEMSIIRLVLLCSPVTAVASLLRLLTLKNIVHISVKAMPGSIFGRFSTIFGD